MIKIRDTANTSVASYLHSFIIEGNAKFLLEISEDE